MVTRHRSSTCWPRAKIVADDEVKVTFEMQRFAADGKTGTPVADITRYTYRDVAARYVVTFTRQRTILQAPFANGACHRFTGKVTVEKFDQDMRVKIFDRLAIWELMYFGKAPSPRYDDTVGSPSMAWVPRDRA